MFVVSSNSMNDRNSKLLLVYTVSLYRDVAYNILEWQNKRETTIKMGEFEEDSTIIGYSNDKIFSDWWNNNEEWNDKAIEHAAYDDEWYLSAFQLPRRHMNGISSRIGEYARLVNAWTTTSHRDKTTGRSTYQRRAENGRRRPKSSCVLTE